MFCPACECEFRAGFTRCEPCGVDLVEDLSAADAAPATAGGGQVQASPSPGPVSLTPYCGFLALDEARRARDQLRDEGIRWEIAIRETPESVAGGPLEEEFWLKVESSRMKQVREILGFAVADDSAEEGESACGDCGKSVSEEESFCPHCGARFDED